MSGLAPDSRFTTAPEYLQICASPAALLPPHSLAVTPEVIRVEALRPLRIGRLMVSINALVVVRYVHLPTRSLLV